MSSFEKSAIETCVTLVNLTRYGSLCRAMAWLEHNMAPATPTHTINKKAAIPCVPGMANPGPVFVFIVIHRMLFIRFTIYSMADPMRDHNVKW
jgi:hypothetical protein